MTEGDIERLRQEVNFLQRESKGELGLKKTKEIEWNKWKIQSEKKRVENCDWGAEAKDACENSHSKKI